MTTLFLPNPSFLSQLVREAEFQSGMQQVAEAGLADALDHVPVDTGELKDSLHIEDGPDGGKRIVVGTDHWLYVEFGTSTQEPEPFLRPIPQDIGLKPG